jgi:hypothetical protein
VEFRAEVEVEELDVTDGSIRMVWASKFLEKCIYFFINTIAFRHNVPVTFSRFVTSYSVRNKERIEK